MRKFPLPSRRARTGCSVLALATVFVVGPSPAAAQSFLGTGTANNGAGTTITNGPGTTTISVTAPQTVIDWVPTDNATNNGVPIAFQNSGTTASFLGTGNYAVLNNIVAADLSRVISMNGTITAGPLGAVSASGGIYFYSPSGILLGGGSMINVGSLVLSASPIFVDDSGNFVNGPARQVIFGPALHPTAAITTDAGSQINTTTGDVYVAMVAPRVEHGGSINANGSVALVAAEAAVINFSPDGLFDIQVTTGTTDSEGVSVNGDITGSASTNPGLARRAFLVAVPKNTALTMLIGSGADLGFDVAGAANVSGNAVILSAGHDIVDGAIGGVSAGSVAGTLANLEVDDSTYTSAVFGDTTGYAHFFANSPMYFHSAVDIHADGEIWFSTQGSEGTIDVDGSLKLSTERHGLFGQSVTTSLVNLYTINGGGRITVDGSTTLDSTAHGGQSGTSEAPGGDASAGVIRVSALDGGTIQLFGGLTAAADAYVGGAIAAGVDGGDALGGDIIIRTTGDNSNLTINGATSLTANAYGGRGDGLECFSCDGDGGDGRGGDIDIYSDDGSGATLNGNVSAIADGFGGAAQAATAVAGTGYGGTTAFYVGTDSRMILNGTLLLQAEGNGGSHSGGDGGAGLGGEAAISETLTATSGTIVIYGDVELSSDGQGGNSSGVGASGGTGTGGGGTGSSYILSDTGSIDIDGDVDLYSSGTGGASINGDGGIGNGGESSLRSNGRLIITGEATLAADGTGGNSSGGTGGIGYGGDLAEIIATGGGDIRIEGYASVSASGYGGDGVTGGDGYGSGDYDELTETWSGGAHIFARDGDIDIKGGAQVSATGTGGDASFDPYAGDYGGAGGDGFGGYATIHAANSDFGPSSITIDTGESEGSGIAAVYVDGHGGNGGDGGDGGTGGAGGSGTGGTGGIHAAAGNGTVTIDQAYGYARGFGGGGGNGGDGGNGGEGFEAAGGDGGVGGLGVGGDITVGTVSGTLQSVAVNQGLGDYGSVTIDVRGDGGDGGDGGLGSTSGNGGHGGDATGGAAILLVRGSRVDADYVWLNADGYGGDGGLGDGETSLDGNGGNARVGSDGGIAVLVTDRNLIPDHRGTLNAGSIDGSAVAIGGNGATEGTSQNFGGSQFTFRNADGNIGSVDFLVSAASQGSGAITESISVIDGDVIVDGEFSFVTSGNLSLFADNGDMHAGALTLDAGDFMYDAVNDPPSDRGTYFADVATITTGNNFVTSADLDIGSDLEIIAPGLINAANINASGELYLEAQSGSIETFNLAAGGNIDLLAATDIKIGNATAGSTIDMDAGGYIDGGNLTAGDSVYAEAGEYVDLLNISAGIVNQAELYDADHNVGILAGTTIDTGDIEAFNGIGLGAAGDIATGDIDAGSIFLALSGGNMSFGAINAAGQTYLADDSMIALGGDPSDGDFDPAPILAATPVASGGSITVNGAVTTGSFQAAAGDNLVTKAITANSIEASAGETATIDGRWLAPSVSLASGDINITVNGSIEAGSSGSILLNAVSTDGPALIGDGLTGNGYALSNAEFGRISGGEITIEVGGSGGDADMMIGDLTITGPLAGSNVESSDGGVHFVTRSETGGEPDGSLRVVGDVVATGFGAENYLAFYTQNFELDAATGSIAITSSGTALAGIFELFASRIHIAEDGLLDQLAVNPQFAGYREALNSPAAVQRPEGVIRAASFDVEFGGEDITGPYTLFVQNMATAAVPAGFLFNAARIGAGDGEGAGALSPGSVDMAINVQIITAGGTSTGIAVRDLLVAQFGTTPFVAGSTINGCPLTGSCGSTSPTVHAPTSADITLGGATDLGEGQFGNENEIADGEGGEGSGRTNPITPPNPLFDSRPLTQSGDIDDPVSGAGNPSLYGLPDEGTVVCDSVKDKSCKVSEKGDGK